ncbi:unnamed protein product, partial [Ectocarpus sp. 12 AP-2014]
MGLIEALREATEFSRTLSSPEAFLVVMAELLLDGFEDPPAMLGYCTRRLCCAVSALPQPSSSASRAVAARSQLRSLAKGGPAASGGGGGGSSSGSTRSSLASSTTLAAAAASATVAAAAAAAVLTPEPPPTAASPTSTATVGVTPVSVSATWVPQDRPSLLVRAAAVGGGESGASDGREEG